MPLSSVKKCLGVDVKYNTKFVGVEGCEPLDVTPTLPFSGWGGNETTGGRNGAFTS